MGQNTLHHQLDECITLRQIVIQFWCCKNIGSTIWVQVRSCILCLYLRNWMLLFFFRFRNHWQLMFLRNPALVIFYILSDVSQGISREIPSSFFPPFLCCVTPSCSLFSLRFQFRPSSFRLVLSSAVWTGEIWFFFLTQMTQHVAMLSR